MCGPINLVFVPWYVETSILAEGKTLEIIEDRFIGDELGALDFLSKLDYNDLILFNSFITTSILSLRDFDTKYAAEFLVEKSQILFTNAVDLHEENVRLINTLSNIDIDFKDTFTMTQIKNTTYVTIKDGFTNFIKHNDKILLREIMNVITDFLFKYNVREDVLNSIYFKKVLSLEDK